MSEEEAAPAVMDNGDADASHGSPRGRGRGRGRGDSRGRGRGAGGRGRGRGRGGAAATDEEHATADDLNTTTDGDDSANAEATENGGRGRGRGRGGRGGRGRGGARGLYRPLREVPEPDPAAWSASTSAHSSALFDLNARIDSFTTKIEASVKTRKAVREELRSAQSAADALTAQKTELFSTYNRMREHIASLESQSIQRKRDVESARKELPYHTLAELDAAIKALERQLNSRTLVIAEERAALDKLKELRTMRPRVLDYERRSKETGATKEEVDALVAEREEAHKHAYEKKDEEDAVRRRVEESAKKEKGLTKDIDGWIAARRALITQRQSAERDWAIREEQHARAVRDYESYAKEKAWRDGEDERRAKEKADYEARQARRERFEAERAEREEADRTWREEREREEAEKDPWEHEKSVVDELLKYMDKLSVKRQEGELDDSTDEKAAQEELLSQRVAAFGGKAAKPLEPKAKKDSLWGDAVAERKEKKVKAKKVTRVLTHVPDVFALFKEVEVEAPLLSKDIEPTLQRLREREAYYLTAPRSDKKANRKGQAGGKRPQQHEASAAAEAEDEDDDEDEDEDEEVQTTTEAVDEAE